ncbi:odorant receptor 26 isoform X2 [Nomia melanderi]|uniref:odorant receptor 26 isoform X2 n=1 Tax=Nomia melanderi TaxID=2448451 RepID=UPI0013047716|nr:odorant receptor 4-like [Nomia melanderi]
MANVRREESVSNVHHAKDYNYTVEVNRWFLKPIGVWPNGDEATRIERSFSKLLNVTCHLLITFTFGPCLLYIMFEDVSLYAKMQAIGPMSHWLMGELNYCSLSMKTTEILQCMSYVKMDWKTVTRSKDRQLMLKNARVGRMIALVAALCMNVGIVSYNLVTGFQKTVFIEGNQTYQMLRLPCPFYTKLIDVRHSPMNEIVYTIQILSSFMVNFVTVGACGLAAVLATHACGQLSVVRSQLESLVEQDHGTTAHKKLAAIVERHSRALNFVSYIENIMHLICLVELTGCTLNMCMLEYYMLTENSKQTLATYTIVYASMVCNIFIFCYIGEKLTEQCRQVGEKAYMTDWYRLPYKTANGLVLVILRSGLVTRLTAGKLLPMTITTFGDVYKTSFVYFNMLRTVAI